jgi:hypothetical protein
VGRRFLVAALASAVLANGCHGGGDKSAIAVRSAEDARAAVHDARVVRPLSFDGDALRIDVARGRPAMTEASAIARFRAGFGGLVTAVTVAYGSATLRTPVKSTGMVVRPRTAPVFRSRPVWAIVWSLGEHGCTLEAGSDEPGPEPFDVELLADDGSGEGVDVQTRGSLCGAPAIGPRATVAGYELSVPWRPGPASAVPAVLNIGAVPACGVYEGRTVYGKSTAPVVRVQAYVLLAPPPCTRPAPPAVIPRPGDADTRLQHAPTGPVIGRETDRGRLVYFDGQTHTLRNPPTTAAR